MRARRGAASLSASFAGGDGNLVWGSANTMGRLQSDQGSSIESADRTQRRLNPSPQRRRQLIDTDGSTTNTLYVYVWNNFSIYDWSATTWNDIYLHAIHYLGEGMNGTFEQSNLQYF
jgi:hypothetical protein